MSVGRRAFLQVIPGPCLPIPAGLERGRWCFELGGSRRIPDHLIVELLEEPKDPSVAEVFSAAQQAIQAQSEDRAFTAIVDD